MRIATSNSSSKRSGAVEVEAGGDARKADAGVPRGDAQPGLAPERVLGFLHVAEEAAEVHDAGGVGFVELNAAANPMFRPAGGFRQCHRSCSPSSVTSVRRPYSDLGSGIQKTPIISALG